MREIIAWHRQQRLPSSYASMNENASHLQLCAIVLPTSRIPEMLPSTSDRMNAAGLVAIVGLTQSALFAYLPVMAMLTALPPGALALATGTGMVVTLFVAPWTGRLADRAGYRAVLLWLLGGLVVSQTATALVVTGAAVLAPPAQTTLALLIGARMVHGAAVGGIVPVMQGWISARVDGGPRLHGLASISAGISAGRLLGPLVVMGGLLAGPLGPVWLLSGLALLAFVAAAVRTESQPIAVPRVKPAGPARLGAAALGLLVFGFVLNAAFGAVHFTFGLLLQAKLEVSSVAAANWLGIITAVAAAMMLVVQAQVVPRLAHRPGNAVIGGLVMVTAGCGLLAATDDLLPLGGGLCCLAVGMGVLVPVYSFVLSELAPAGQQGRFAGYLAFTHTLSYAAGAIAGGYAFEHAPWLPAAAGCLLAPGLLAFAGIGRATLRRSASGH